MPQSTILCNLNLNGNELRNIALESLTTHPENSKISRIYFNSTDKCVYVLQSKSPDKWIRLNGVEFKENPNDNTKTIAYLTADSVELSSEAIATGLKALAEGSSTATGNYSHAEGFRTDAEGEYSHAEGIKTTASGNGSHAEGDGESDLDVVEFTPTALTQSEKDTLQAVYGLVFDYIDESDELEDDTPYIIFSDEDCTQKVAEMAYAKYVDGDVSGDAFKLKTSVQLSGTYYAKRLTGALGYASHAEGQATIASDSRSHAEGQDTTASGDCSHAEGIGTIASGSNSHAEGSFNITYGNNSHAEGYNNTVLGNSSHAEGNNTRASESCAHSEGVSTTASGYASHAEGSGSIASGDAAHAEGYAVDGGQILSSGAGSHAEGHSIYGGRITASGAGAHAEGHATSLDGGGQIIASGMGSHAEGYSDDGGVIISSNYGSHAEGMYTTASGPASHAEGSSTVASGESSHSEGDLTTASGDYSHAEGYKTIAQRKSQHVCGEYNIADTQGADGTVRGKYALIVGNGTGDDARSNAFAIDWDGNLVLFNNGTPVVLTPAKLAQLIA